MKRIFAVVFIVALLTGALPAAAEDISAPAFSLAQHVPADAVVFVGVRIDDATIATIDGLIAHAGAVAADLGATLPGDLTIRGALASGRVSDEVVENFFAGAGDTLAFGVLNDENAPGLSVFVVDVADRAALEAALAGLDLTPGETQGRYTVYENGFQTIFLSDETMVAANDSSGSDLSSLASGDYARLSNDAGFIAQVGELPADDYIAGVYVNPANVADLQMLGGTPTTTVSAVAAGVALFDGDTLTLDLAVKDDTMPVAVASIDPAFARFVPADSRFVAHSTGLGASLGTVFDLLVPMTIDGPSPREHVAGVLSGFGVDLNELIAWTSGDYAVFGRVDLPALFQATVPGSFDADAIADAFDFGLVIETDNPEASADLVHAFGSLARMASNQAPGATLSEEEIGGATASVLTVTQEALGGPGTLRLAAASNDEIFVVGTYDAVTAALTQAAGFDSSPLAQDASRYWLADASMAAVVDGATVAQYFGILGLAVMGPTVSSEFASIAGTLGTATTSSGTPEPTATPAPTPTPVPTPDPMPQLMAQLERLEQAVRHLTVSSRNTDGGLLVRITLTLGE